MGTLQELGGGAEAPQTNAIMTEQSLQVLVEEGKFAELEDRWLDQMTSGASTVDEFLNIARLLGRQKEKDRAGMLLALLAEHLREQENWPARYRVLTEIARHTADPKKIEDLKDHLEECLKKIYTDAPSFSQILNQFRFHEIKTPEELRPCLDKVLPWLTHDVGQLFYEPGRGVGRVREINMNLGFLRVDFEKRKDVTVDVADSDLLPLKKGHILWEKVEQPETLRERALNEPAEVLGLLLQQMGRAMGAGEIKDCLIGIIPENQWSKWWSAAKKNPQVVSEGKGAQALYSWTASTEQADQSIRKAFHQADTKARLDLVKQHASRSPELKRFFEEELLKTAQEAWTNKKWRVALELLDLISKTTVHVDPGFTFEDVLRAADPIALIAGIDQAQMKLRVLDAYRNIDPDRWMDLAGRVFLREENPRVLGFLFESIQAEAPDKLDLLLEQIIHMPHSYAGVISWMCQIGEQDGLDMQNHAIGRHLNGKFLISLLNTLDDAELSSHRNRIKKSLETGLLINILGNGMDAESAGKAIEKLEHSTSIEDYRRDRWKNTIRMRFPEFKQKEEYIFTTKEAYERKRLELENIVQVELPKNRKAVGEAAALGDLSENHEYKAARERQDYLINRVQQLQNDLNRVRVLQPGKTDAAEVRPGTRVTLAQNDSKLVMTVLGPWDSNPNENVYSYQSPIGMNLLGKTTGDRVQWNDITWRIEKIEPW